MKRSIFILGFARSLCEAELTQVLQNKGLTYKIVSSSPHHLDILSDPAFQETLMNQLGGTVKIAKFLTEITPFSSEDISTFIASLDVSRSVTIGISNYSSQSVSLEHILKKTKEILTEKGIKVRFILPQHSQQLSTIVVKKQKVHEFILTDTVDKKGLVLSQIVAISDSEAWSKRDFGRPEADPKSGMLPPKVARMMVNLASSKFGVKNAKKVLLDPFCGMGTILGEALLLGYQVIGADISAQVISKTQKNLEWLQKEYTLPLGLFRLLNHDALHLTQVLSPSPIDVIVTEPFLGAPFEERRGILYQKAKPVTQKSVKNTIKGLEKMFIGGFKEWQKLLVPQGCLVIALPSITFDGQTTVVKSVIDNCENLGYTLEQGPYEYARVGAIVKREIYIFRRK